MSSQAPRSNVFLIGPMGSGKTAVGKQLARLLHLHFYDSDVEIERRTGVDIPYIFEKEGEAGFREREREVIDCADAARRTWSSRPAAAPCCCRRIASGSRPAAASSICEPASSSSSSAPGTVASGRCCTPTIRRRRLRELMDSARAALRIHRQRGRRHRWPACAGGRRRHSSQQLQEPARDMSASAARTRRHRAGRAQLSDPDRAAVCCDDAQLLSDAHRGARPADRDQRNDRAAVSGDACRTRCRTGASPR